MKRVLCLWWLVLVLASSLFAKDDFYAYDDHGGVRLHGVYTTDANDRVIRYDLYDGDGALLSVEIPYYSADGRIIRSDSLDADGQLVMVAVPLGEVMILLDAEGQVVGREPMAQAENG